MEAQRFGEHDGIKKPKTIWSDCQVNTSAVSVKGKKGNIIPIVNCIDRSDTMYGWLSAARTRRLARTLVSNNCIVCKTFSLFILMFQ